MGREIKFKIWLPGIKKMTYEHTLEEMMNWGTKEWTNGTAIFLQCTGLKDKNGREICEGDILQIPDLYETPENTSTTYHTAAVDFEEFGFRVDGSQLCEDYQYISDECEVIGNIYENPELLEV